MERGIFFRILLVLLLVAAFFGLAALAYNTGVRQGMLVGAADWSRRSGCGQCSRTGASSAVRSHALLGTLLRLPLDGLFPLPCRAVPVLLFLLRPALAGMGLGIAACTTAWAAGAVDQTSRCLPGSTNGTSRSIPRKQRHPSRNRDLL